MWRQKSLTAASASWLDTHFPTVARGLVDEGLRVSACMPTAARAGAADAAARLSCAHLARKWPVSRVHALRVVLPWLNSVTALNTPHFLQHSRPRARCAGGRQCCKEVPHAQGHRSPYHGSTDSKACTIKPLARFRRQSAQVSRAAVYAVLAHAALGMHAPARRAREGVNQGVCTIMVICSSTICNDHACGLQPAVDLKVGAF